MGLRNAFEEIATERTLRKLLEHMRFAKDSSDRMRVTVDNQPSVTVWSNNTGTAVAGAGTQPGLFQPSSWNIMDGREEFREITQQTFQITRNRWTIT